ncbi:MAG TPA: copper homeostasis protein CutC [Gemmatimonadaceae bacterium]
MTRPILEIAANSFDSALSAQEGGADRIELCENLGEGGTTPSYGTLAMTRDRLRGLEADWWETDAGMVRAMVKALATPSQLSG